MPKPDLTDYVDVAERMTEFREKHPEGSFQVKIVEIPAPWNEKFVAVEARAYRSPDDERPGVDVAWEPVPGKTPYTKDSELMNCSTSAVGRAIVYALAADTKRGIASKQEVMNRNGGADGGGGDSLSQSPNSAAVGFASDKQRKFYDRLLKASVPASAQSTVTRYLDQTPSSVVHAAIDSLKDKDTAAIDGLLLEATNWESAKSDVPYDETA